MYVWPWIAKFRFLINLMESFCPPSLITSLSEKQITRSLRDVAMLDKNEASEKVCRSRTKAYIIGVGIGKQYWWLFLSCNNVNLLANSAIAEEQ